MKTIAVSTEVFAAIWREHQEGEDTEDAILRRLLKLADAPRSVEGSRMGGFWDERSQTHFPEGTRIFRVYKGHKVEAIAQADRWVLQGSFKTFHSLHKLTKAVNPAGSENAWATWKWRDENGVDHLINEAFRQKQKGKK